MAVSFAKRHIFRRSFYNNPSLENLEVNLDDNMTYDDIRYLHRLPDTTLFSNRYAQHLADIILPSIYGHPFGVVILLPGFIHCGRAGCRISAGCRVFFSKYLETPPS